MEFRGTEDRFRSAVMVVDLAGDNLIISQLDERRKKGMNKSTIPLQASQKPPDEIQSFRKPYLTLIDLDG